MSRGQAFWAMMVLVGILGLGSVSSADESSPKAADPAPATAAGASDKDTADPFYEPFGSAAEPASAPEQAAEGASEPDSSAGSAEAPAVADTAPPAEADSAPTAEPAAGEGGSDSSGFYNSFTPGLQGSGEDAGAGGETDAAAAGTADAAPEAEAPAADTTATEETSVAQEVPVASDGGENWGDSAGGHSTHCDGDSPYIGRPEEHVFADAAACGSCNLCPDGTGSFIELGYAYDRMHGNEDSVDQYGYSPRDWFSNGKLYYGDAYFSRNRFELRWDDVTSEAGRAWGRVSVWPFTLEGDSYILDIRAWDSFGADPALVRQEVSNDELKLRLHRGEWDSMLLSYRDFEVQREGNGPLDDHSLRRLAYQYNFDIGSDVQGQFRQTATSFDADAAGFDGAEIDNSQLKLDAQLSDSLSAHGKFSASAYQYDNLPDNEMTSHDYNVGLRYKPGCRWEFSADYRAKDNPDDNIVSSHVQGYEELGVGLSYLADCGLYEAGVKHRSLDYAKLNMQDAFVFSLLRNTAAVVRPVDVASATTILSPEYDEAFFNMRQQLSDSVYFTTRLDFSQGDNPSTELTTAHSPSLFYDQRLSRNHGLSWVYDRNNQFDFTFHGAELANDDRATNFDESYFEGAWNHAMDDGRFFSLAYRKSEADLEVPAEVTGYTTDGRSYVASYSEEREDFGYALRFALDDGSGTEDFRQTSAGADLNLKCLGPVGLKLDWYDRNYRNFPGFDAGAFTVSVAYKLEF